MGSPLACTQGPAAMEKYLVIFLLFALSCVFAEPEPYGRRYGYRRGYGYGGYRGRYRGYGHYGKRSVDAVATPDADADADPYYRSYGYGGYRGFYGRGYYGYGKRSADAEADAYYRGYGYGYRSYGGYRGYGYGRYGYGGRYYG